MRFMFLKDILNENPESLIFKFIMTQYNNPTRGDWVSGCVKDLQYWHERAAFQRSSFGRSRSGGRLLAMT